MAYNIETDEAEIVVFKTLRLKRDGSKQKPGSVIVSATRRFSYPTK
ncbi:MAG: hypothetical protein FWC50_13750 [Planctomycetaceae bacterium]|nr:hypothetical protein [Planctomycetaceae bacterium]